MSQLLPDITRNSTFVSCLSAAERARVEPEGGVVAAADGAEGARAEKARGDEARGGESHEEGHVVVVVSGAFGVVSMFSACGVRGSLLRRGSYRRGYRLRRDTTAVGRSDVKPFRRRERHGWPPSLGFVLRITVIIPNKGLSS